MEGSPTVIDAALIEADTELSRLLTLGLGLFAIAEAYSIICGQRWLTRLWRFGSMKKKKRQFAMGRSATEHCVVCNQEHRMDQGTWVILGTGELTCSNNKCWRILYERSTRSSDKRIKDTDKPCKEAGAVSAAVQGAGD